MLLQDQENFNKYTEKNKKDLEDAEMKAENVTNKTLKLRDNIAERNKN